MRLYALIKNLEPLEAYFCNEGLVRFCTEDYCKPTEDNYEKLYMHLTNYSLNKDNEKYINPTNYGEENKGTKRLLSHFFKQLIKDQSIDEEYVKDQLVTTVRKTIISLIPYLKAWAKKYIRPELDKIRWFQLIGIDIMLDEDWKAWLFEINANPSMNMYLEKEGLNGEIEKTLSELDKHLKTTILQDVFHIVRTKDSVGHGWFEKILPIEGTDTK